MMLFDKANEDATVQIQGLERTFLIRTHETAIAGYIGGQNGGKAALDAFFGHVVPCLLRTQCEGFYGYSDEESIGPLWVQRLP
jgi:hypothetical protein